MTGIIIRICLRYLAAFMVARGALSPDTSQMIASDPDIAAGLEMAVGAAMGASVEIWLWLERKFGWNV